MSLSPRAKDLLRAAAPLHEPSKDDEARVLASIAGKVAAAGSLVGNGGIPATTSAATTKAAWLKLAIKIAAVAFVGPASVGLYLALDPARHATPATVAPSVVLSPSGPAADAPALASTTPVIPESEVAAVVPTATNTPAPPSPDLPSRPSTTARPGVRSATEEAARTTSESDVVPEGNAGSLPAPAVGVVAPSEPSANAAQSTAMTPPVTPPGQDGPAPLTTRASSDGPRAAYRGEYDDRDAGPPTAAAEGLAQELALLRQAEQALRSGNPAGALASLDEHARRFPTGSLAEERTVSRILALCAAGRTEEAGSIARTFVSSRPHSPHLPRVRASCGISGSK